MPKVLSYTPPWLCRPSAGFDFFSPPPGTVSPSRGRQENEETSRDNYQGPRRTIARRGTEIFTVVGNEIRWSDLVYLKEHWEQQEKSRRAHNGKQKSGLKYRDNHSYEGSEDDEERDNYLYRVLKVPVTRDITQLSISPQGSYMAIITSHTAHVAILPDPSHLTDQDTGPLRLKTFQLGPTAHVLENSCIASTLWHPLGVSGTCLVTVTTDAVVRLWEIDKGNRWSFDNPALAIDLKKLANGTSAQEDFSASKYGANKGYSPDSLEMEVAAACFGGRGSEEEHGWAAMTLWIAMREGDVYALCPLLPSKWCPPSTLIPSLSTSVVSKAAAIEASQHATEEERRQSEQQYKWFSEVDKQDPVIVSGSSPFEEIHIYSRPQAPGPVPRLQGPYQMDPDVEDDFEVTDIHVIAAKLDDEEWMIGEDFESTAEDVGLSVGIGCLMTKMGRVYICLDIDETQAQWLPSKRSKRVSLFDEVQPSLLHFETLEVFPADKQFTQPPFPTFSSDVHSRYSLFVNHNNGLSFFSLDPWIQLLEEELKAKSDAGGAFRLDLLLSSTKTLIEDIARFPQSHIDRTDSAPPSCIALQDSDVGYMVLTTVSDQPFAAVLDAPSSFTDGYVPDEKPLAIMHPATSEPRQLYQAHPAFYQRSALPTLFSGDTTVSGRVLRSMREEIKFSPATLQILTEVHRTLSEETYELGVATADLFRRCERLREELKGQVRKVAEANGRVQALVGEDDDEEDERVDGADRDAGGKTKLERRVKRAEDKQDELARKYERLRTKVSSVGNRELSNQEKSFANEVDRMRQTVLANVDEADGNGNGAKTTDNGSLYRRYQEVKSLKDELIAQIPDRGRQEDNGRDSSETEDKIEKGREGGLSELRRTKMKQVMTLLERETALVDATRGRLERLSVG